MRLFKSAFGLLLITCFIVFLRPSLKSQVDTSFLHLFFEMGNSVIHDGHLSVLSAHFETLDSLATYRLRIEGFADFVGTTDSNLKLSNARADSIAHALEKNFPGLISTIETAGFGEMPSGGAKDRSIGIPKHRKATVWFIKEPPPLRIKVADIDPENIEYGRQLILDELQFHPGRHVLIPKSIPALKQLLHVLKTNPHIAIEIHGHICCGEGRVEPDGLDIDTKKLNLSVSRAENIYNYLIRNEIDPERLSYRGFGFTKPLIYPEISDQDAQRNRRVEIKLKRS